MSKLQEPAVDGTQGPSRAAASARAAGALETELPALRQRLLRHARFSLHDQSLAEDLVQDTLMAVVEQAASRQGSASLVTWATAILKHKVADWYRSPNRRRIVQLTSEDEQLGQSLQELYDTGGNYARPVPAVQQPENQLEQREMMTVLDRCVSCLPRQTGHVFMMREWLGFENAEICDRIGISAENCRTILFRARTALRVCMQRDWIEGRSAAA